MRTKILIIAVVACMVLSISGLAYAAALTDIEGNWAKHQIEKMVTSGAVKGYPDGSFKPEAKVSRAEFTTLVNRAFEKVDQNAKANFADVKETDWHYVQVASGKSAGYIAGYTDNTFKPDNAISREEVAVILTKLLKLDANNTDAADVYTDVQNIAPWAKGSVAAVTTGKVMKGYFEGSFKPYKLITRAEAVVAIYTALELSKPSVVSSGSSSSNNNNNNDGGTMVNPITNIVAAKVQFLGNTYLYNVKGDVNSTVYSLEIVIGSDTFSANIANGKFAVERAIDGNYTAATVIAKTANGTVLRSYQVDITQNGSTTPVISNSSGLKAQFMENAYLYSVEGDVNTAVYEVEITIGSDTFKAALANGHFVGERSVDGNYASALVKAKAADGSVLQSVSVLFTTNNTPPNNTPADQITNTSGSKAAFAGNTYLYFLTGEAASGVSTVEITIGTDTFSVTPANGGFSAERAVDGNHASAMVIAKTATGTVLESVTVHFSL